MKKYFLIILIGICTHLTFGQKAALVSVDKKGIDIDSSTLAQIARSEAGKILSYEMMDRYDIEEILRKNNYNQIPCYSKTCLVQAGKLLGANIMITATIEKVGNKIALNIREINVDSNKISKSYIEDYLFLPSEMTRIFRCAFHKMYQLPIDESEFLSLTNPNYLPGSKNNPEEIIMKNSGPRFGFVGFTGESADYIKRPKTDGGLGGYPVMFQFGYQFEKQYLNEGNLQGLVEIIPLITGTDQGRFVPSLTLLNGLREQKNGWEFAFGPSFTFARKATGYFDSTNTFVPSYYNPQNYPLVERLDSRGDVQLVTGFVIGVGKTIKTGRLNMPFNAYIKPTKKNIQFGLSWGFNVSKSKK